MNKKERAVYVNVYYQNIKNQVVDKNIVVHILISSAGALFRYDLKS